MVFVTRQHSSRMRTDCRSGLHSGRGQGRGKVYTPLAHSTLPILSPAYPALPIPYHLDPLPPERTWNQGLERDLVPEIPYHSCEQTDACENITFPQLCWRSVNMARTLTSMIKATRYQSLTQTISLGQYCQVLVFKTLDLIPLLGLYPLL